MSIRSVAMASLSNIINVCLFSFFFLVSLARSLSILLIFLNNHFLALLILSIISLFSLSLISAFIFIFSSSLMIPCSIFIKILLVVNDRNATQTSISRGKEIHRLR